MAKEFTDREEFIVEIMGLLLSYKQIIRECLAKLHDAEDTGDKLNMRKYDTQLEAYENVSKDLREVFKNLDIETSL